MNITKVGIVSALGAMLIAATVPSPGLAAATDSNGGARPECTITGTEGDDWIIGSPHADVICGLGGDDTIDGGGGADIIIGGPGYDLIAGRADLAKVDLQGGEIVSTETTGVTEPGRSTEITYGALQAAALADDRIKPQDMPDSPPVIITIIDKPLCLTPEDQGALYRAQEARNEEMIPTGVAPQSKGPSKRVCVLQGSLCP